MMRKALQRGNRVSDRQPKTRKYSIHGETEENSVTFESLEPENIWYLFLLNKRQNQFCTDRSSSQILTGHINNTLLCSSVPVTSDSAAAGHPETEAAKWMFWYFSSCRVSQSLPCENGLSDVRSFALALERLGLRRPPR